MTIRREPRRIVITAYHLQWLGDDFLNLVRIILASKELYNLTSKSTFIFTMCSIPCSYLTNRLGSGPMIEWRIMSSYRYRNIVLANIVSRFSDACTTWKKISRRKKTPSNHQQAVCHVTQDSRTTTAAATLSGKATVVSRPNLVQSRSFFYEKRN